MPRHPYDLVILDLDGTILDPFQAGGISPAVRETVAQVQATGVPVTIATGRTLDYVRAYVQPMGIVTPVVTTQGAVLGDPVSGHVIDEAVLPMAEAMALAGWADETARVSAFFFTDEDGHIHIRQNLDVGRPEFYDHVMGEGREIVGSLTALLEHPAAYGPVKYMMISDVTDEPALAAELQSRFGRGVTVTRTHPLLVEVTAQGVDKGSGVLKLCRHLGVSPERVLAIGDNDNDIPMLMAVGMRVAMGNGSSGVKEIAHWVAPGIDEDGAAVAMRRFVLNKGAP